MAQPYDFSAFVGLQATLNQMVSDQTRGVTKFAGGSQAWLKPQQGLFNAILTVGGSATQTSTASVAALLAALQIAFALLAGTTGTSATVAAQAAIPPALALAAGIAPWEDSVQSTVTGGGATVQQTNYDLSGIAALQTTVNQMIADKSAGTSNFAGGEQTWLKNPTGTFQADLGRGTKTTTLRAVMALMAAVMATFALLDQ